jgi:hypothetical protein
MEALIEAGATATNGKRQARPEFQHMIEAAPQSLPPSILSWRIASRASFAITRDGVLRQEAGKNGVKLPSITKLLSIT